jgi:PAS domain S-box-containing protein
MCVTKRNKTMRGKVLGWLVQATAWGLAAALGLVTLPVSIGALANKSSLPGEEQKRTEEDRCKFLMENVGAIILTLNPEGRITFLNHYGQSFFGYSDKEVLSKPMLGTLTPVAGFEGRDMATFLAEVVRHPDQYAFSVNQNMLHGGERVWIFWANKGVSGEHGEVREVLRVGLDITERKLRLQAAAQALRGIGEMLEGRSWVQRKKLKEITGRIKEISQELERPWEQSDSGAYESVVPPDH